MATDISDIWEQVPQHIEAEKGVLSCIMQDNEVMYLADEYRLGASDFYQSEHAVIYEAIIELHKIGRVIDIITLHNQLQTNNKIDIIGGDQTYLYELAAYTMTSSMAGEYIKIVKEKSILRNIISTCKKVIGECQSQNNSTDIIDSVEKRIFELTQSNFANQEVVHISDILNKRSETLMSIVDDPSLLNKGKIASDYRSLDHITGGFKPGELIILAARPSMGKTAFGLSLILNAAINQKKTCLFFSLEMTADSIVDRLISTVGHISMSKLTTGGLTTDDFEKLGNATARLGDTHIYIDDRGGTLAEIRSKIRKLKIEKGIDIVVIDYLQLINTSGNKYAGNKVQEISELSRSLKLLSKEMDIPVIALSQLSREVEKRPDKRPILSDLRDSGSIEQDADMVMFLYRDEYYNGDDAEKRGITDILLRKNRNGTVGDVELKSDLEYMQYSDV